MTFSCRRKHLSDYKNMTWIQMVMIDDGPQWHMSDPINDDGNDGANDVLVDEDDDHHDFVDDVLIDVDVDAMYYVLENGIHFSLTTFE